MNKIFFKALVLVVIGMMANEVKSSEQEKKLQQLEQAIYPKIGIILSLKNIYRLSAYAKEVDDSLPMSNVFNGLSNDIEDASLLRPRLEFP